MSFCERNYRDWNTFMFWSRVGDKIKVSRIFYGTYSGDLVTKWWGWVKLEVSTFQFTPYHNPTIVGSFLHIFLSDSKNIYQCHLHHSVIYMFLESVRNVCRPLYLPETRRHCLQKILKRSQEISRKIRAW